MIRKVLLLLLLLPLLLPSKNTIAKEDNVNIYDAPRKAPITPIYHESGKRYQLKEFKGQFLLVVFWSKKCAICVRELDDLNNFNNIVKNNGIKVIAISPSTEWEDAYQAKRFMERYDAPDLEVFLDENGNLAADFGIYATPHNVLINKKGEEIGRIRGGADWDDEDIIEFMYKLKAKNG